MKDRYIYPAVLKFEDDSILVEFPDLEGCITFGENEEEALFYEIAVFRVSLFLPKASPLSTPWKMVVGLVTLYLSAFLSLLFQNYLWRKGLFILYNRTYVLSNIIFPVFSTDACKAIKINVYRVTINFMSENIAFTHISPNCVILG